ncbi:MAG: lipopolysaccharide biosynthesis protein [Leptothrix sp. (in: b-proteobacteria)]
MTTFKRNLLASYASQIYVAVIGIVIVPVYIRYMGAEAYGLVGFYAMLQAWFQMLDMGLSPTLSRQTARLSGGAITGLELRRLLRVLEGIFVGVALLGAMSIGLGAHWLATNWLHAQALPTDQVRLSIELMAAIVGLRWVAGLYRGAIGGFEQQVWLGRLNASTATARFVAVLVIFEWLGITPAHFFGWQLLVAVAETTLLWRKTYRLLPPMASDDPPVGWHWHAMRNVIGFSLSIAFTSAVWVGVTQTDKLILSKILPLAEYGHFTLAVLAASGISIISSPLSMALMPKLARLHAEGDNTGLIKLYRQGTQGMAAITMPAALVIGICSEPFLRAWTGDADLAAQAAPALSLYALGNGILALAAFPYYLQFAKGDIRLHLVGNLLFALILVPSIVIAAIHYGAIGAGWAWLIANLTYFLTWTQKVHNKFIPKLHRQWLLSDIAPIFISSLASVVLAKYFMHWHHERTILLTQLVASTLIVYLIGCLASTEAVKLIKHQLRPVANV